jgi:ABC-type bacteriocin/lantibiotic exporter with double-glycine peptidase domain
MSNLKDILANSNKEIDNQKLMDYLSGKLSHAEQQEIEEQMAASDLYNDAMEGLQSVDNKKSLELIQYELSKKLKQQLALKNNKRAKRRIPNFQLTIIAIVLIIVLCILAYVVIKMNEKG